MPDRKKDTFALDYPNHLQCFMTVPKKELSLHLLVQNETDCIQARQVSSPGSLNSAKLANQVKSCNPFFVNNWDQI